MALRFIRMLPTIFALIYLLIFPFLLNPNNYDYYTDVTYLSVYVVVFIVLKLFVKKTVKAYSK